MFEFKYIRSWGFLLLLGFIAGYFLARWRARRQGVSVVHIENLVLLIVLLGVTGGRLFYLAFYRWPGSVWDALAVWEGGLVFYGGALFAGIGSLVYIWIKRLSLAEVADIVAPCVLLGLAFGRVGCFLNGCCWGDVCMAPAELEQRLQRNLQAQGGETNAAPEERLAMVERMRRVRYRLQSVPELSGANFPLAVTFPSNSFARDQHACVWAAGGARAIAAGPSGTTVWDGDVADAVRGVDGGL